MDPVKSAICGLVFVAIGLGNTWFMYHLWGYPFDKETRTSAAPKRLMLAHRILGYAFAGLFVFMLARMLPRLWSYQVEFPARTVVHIVLGMGIAFLLLIKLSILRFFRHLEEWMPYLGTTMALFAVILVGLSAPFAFRESALAAGAHGGGAFSDENRARVSTVLPLAGLPAEAPLAELSGEDALRDGRRILLEKCVRCHDLKTILGRPRVPAEWWGTVSRMAEKPAIVEPIEPREAWNVTAYLVAITPDLQQSAKQARAGATAPGGTARLSAVLDEHLATDAIDGARAEAAFKKACSQCHSPLAIEDARPRSRDDVKKLLARMIENGLACAEDELRLVHGYLVLKFVPEK